MCTKTLYLLCIRTNLGRSCLRPPDIQASLTPRLTIAQYMGTFLVVSAFTTYYICIRKRVSTLMDILNDPGHWYRLDLSLVRQGHVLQVMTGHARHYQHQERVTGNGTQDRGLSCSVSDPDLSCNMLCPGRLSL